MPSVMNPHPCTSFFLTLLGADTTPIDILSLGTLTPGKADDSHLKDPQLPRVSCCSPVLGCKRTEQAPESLIEEKWSDHPDVLNDA